jgi:transcriptional regulator with XRE-family HTH domain
MVMISVASCQTIELSQHSHNGNSCQAKIPKMTTSFEKRLIDVFGLNLKEIAAKLEINYHTFRNWAKGTRDIPPGELARIAKMTNVSLNWLLTGEGEKYVQALESPSLLEVFDERVRKLIREEMASALSPVQELGTIDEFLAASVEKYDNALLVLRDWYAHDNVAIALPQTLDFQGWETYTLEKKVQEIKAAREIMDHNRYLEERLENSHRIKGSK